MSAIALPPRQPDQLERHLIELVWLALAIGNYAARALWPHWETIPLHVGWLALTIVVGLRAWPASQARSVTFALTAVAVAAMTLDALHVVRLWGEPLEVSPLLAAIFLLMVWHSRRRVEALIHAERRADERHARLERQEQFMQDASHELRTPVTIAQGHLELLRRNGAADPELAIALDELARMKRIIERLLLLAGADQPEFLQLELIALEPFLEDEFVRWAEIAPRSWRLGPVATARLRADPERLRTALDILLENAVKYTRDGDTIELRARAGGRGHVVIEVQDGGCGIPADAMSSIFERFRRGDPASRRGVNGVGLGLAIADAIVRRHGGRCTVAPVDDTVGGRGSVFGLELPADTVGSAPAAPESSAPLGLSARA